MSMPLRYGSRILINQHTNQGTFVLEKNEQPLFLSETALMKDLSSSVFILTKPGGIVPTDDEDGTPIRFEESICFRHEYTNCFIVVSGEDSKDLDCVADYVCAKGEEEFCILGSDTSTTGSIVSFSDSFILRSGDNTDFRPYQYICTYNNQLRLEKDPQNASVYSFSLIEIFNKNLFSPKQNSRFPCLLKNHLLKSGNFSGAHQALIFDGSCNNLLSYLPLPLNEQEEKEFVPSIDELKTLFDLLVKRPHISEKVTVNLKGKQYIIPEEKEMVLMLLKRPYDSLYALWRGTRAVNANDDEKILMSIIEGRYLVMINCGTDLQYFMRGRSLMALLVKRSHDNNRLLDF